MDRRADDRGAWGGRGDLDRKKGRAVETRGGEGRAGRR